MKTEEYRKGNPRAQAIGLDGIPVRARPRATLGELLLAAREASGLSIRQAAREAEVSSGAISDMEQGKIKQTAIERLVTLAAVYDVEPLPLIEAAGYNLAPALPTFQPYLRSKYRQLPDAAQAELVAVFERITQKYGISPSGTGPQPNEDESPPNEMKVMRKEALS